MKNENKYSMAKYACYVTSGSMAVVSALSPLLFTSFRSLYGISYTLMGLLVAINFSTQLIVDLIFTFFTKYFNIVKTVKLMPLITAAGLIVFAVMPAAFPNSAYMWIVIGTVIFSVSSGLNEVLTSPVVAAIPSRNPEREMSKLHSAFAWGVVAVVLISTAGLSLLGTENWYILPIFWSVVPLTAFFMFRYAVMPDMDSEEKEESKKLKLNSGILLCTICIFLGGAAECTMSQWASGFLEKATGISKFACDVFGVAMFSVFLGTGRSLYGKYGKNIIKVISLGMAGAFVCYLIAGISLNPFVSLLFCALTGFCTSMLWPGTLIMVEEKYPASGVPVYALMAAGGDLGASLAPQMVGVLSDKIALMENVQRFAAGANITAEQIGIRSGILFAALFPLMGVVLMAIVRMYFKNRNKLPKST